MWAVITGITPLLNNLVITVLNNLVILIRLRKSEPRGKVGFVTLS